MHGHRWRIHHSLKDKQTFFYNFKLLRILPLQSNVGGISTNPNAHGHINDP